MLFRRRLVIPARLAVKNTDELPKRRAILLYIRARCCADAIQAAAIGIGPHFVPVTGRSWRAAAPPLARHSRSNPNIFSRVPREYPARVRKAIS